MNTKQIGKYAFLDAAGTFIYIALVATLMQNANNLFGRMVDGTILAPIAFLLLFVVSASITGGLVLGRPVLWYLDGSKKEAVSLFLWTIGILAGILIVAFVLMAALFPAVPVV